nr:MAG TPA: hypothetical protein [Caudoviricetes sp.]
MRAIDLLTDQPIGNQCAVVQNTTKNICKRSLMRAIQFLLAKRIKSNADPHMIASTQMRYLQIMNKENRGDFLPLFFYNNQFQFHEVLLRQTIDRNLMCHQIFLNAHTMASYLIPYLK